MTQQHRIVALTKYSLKGASSRVRFWNLVPPLQDLGWSVEVLPMLDDEILEAFYRNGRHNYTKLLARFIGRLLTLKRASSPAIWWIEKELLFGLPACIERIVAPFVAEAVIDYDDAVFLNYSDAWLGPLGRRAKFHYYARSAAFLTVGSDSLKSQLVAWGGSRIRSIPSTVNVGSYPVHTHRTDETVVIGWIGTPVTIKFLETLKNILPTLAKREKIVLHIVGAKWECTGVNVVCSEWSEKTEANVVSSFDVGIMPLIDGAWERAKCGYKLIQYMAGGVVPVGARVGENRVIIQDGVNGYLASHPEEWLAKLEMLCGDAQLRAVIGARARETALQKYDVSCAVQAVHEVFTKVVANRQNRTSG